MDKRPAFGSQDGSLAGGKCFQQVLGVPKSMVKAHTRGKFIDIVGVASGGEKQPLSLGEGVGPAVGSGLAAKQISSVKDLHCVQKGRINRAGPGDIESLPIGMRLADKAAGLAYAVAIGFAG